MSYNKREEDIMNIDVRGVHYEISDKVKEHLDKKLEKLKHGESVLNDVSLTIAKRHNDFVLEMSLHFKWGQVDHLKVEDPDLYNAIDTMEEKAITKIRREKEKKIDSYHS